VRALAIGIIGVGTMGRNLALNFADHDVEVLAFDRTFSKAETLAAEHGGIQPCETVEDMIKALSLPRTILMMIPAGEPVDNMLTTLAPLLDEGDIVIDGGNSNFKDTIRRSEAMTEKGLRFVGMGVSGGASGARNGPALMVGGPRSMWEILEPILGSIAASADDGKPCADWMGEGGAGHFVKAVHNGIEYADMQMIAETFGVMRSGLGLRSNEIAETFGHWNRGALESYLIEITAEISGTRDPKTGQPIVDVILDQAAQKGTGRWTVMEAQRLAAPLATIEAAVTARVLSSFKAERGEVAERFGDAGEVFADGEVGLDDLKSALIAGRIINFSMGFDLLRSASREYEMGIILSNVAKVWRAGCIIRSVMLNPMAEALADDPERRLFMAPEFVELLKTHIPGLRKTVSTALACGHAVPALASALSWFDQMRTSRSTANVIQAQRDFFGRHSFERIDQQGSHHGPWANDD